MSRPTINDTILICVFVALSMHILFVLSVSKPAGKNFVISGRTNNMVERKHMSSTTVSTPLFGLGRAYPEPEPPLEVLRWKALECFQGFYRGGSQWQERCKNCQPSTIMKYVSGNFPGKKDEYQKTPITSE
jgi:hypothetical protein